MERTLSIIKPDAVGKDKIGPIISRFEKSGLIVAAMRMLWLGKKEAMRFYAVHKERSFYDSLVEFMISGPVVVMVLEGENAIKRNREIMGATDPSKADAGTIRKDFAEGIEKNAVHGSDSPENARTEIAFFFSETDLVKSRL